MEIVVSFHRIFLGTTIDIFLKSYGGDSQKIPGKRRLILNVSEIVYVRQIIYNVLIYTVTQHKMSIMIWFLYKYEVG